jgi:aspartyl/asparaginyl beta-hydroxylase (cupin superfamily)
VVERHPFVRQDPVAGSASSTVYRSQTTTGEWAGSYLWVFGERVEETCRLCPETARLLGAIPGVAEYGTTLYSGLAPHTFIAPHYGYTNAKLRCQLSLRVPGRCRLKVGDAEIEQREGRCIVFDDSFLHSAWNDSGEPRFVIVFDFFHPGLTPEEIDYLLRLARERKLAKAVLHQAAGGSGWIGRAPRSRRPAEPRGARERASVSEYPDSCLRSRLPHPQQFP